MVAATAVIVLLATLAAVWATDGAGLVKMNSTPTASPPNFVRINSINVNLVYNSTHHFMWIPFGACATIVCPFELSDKGLNGIANIGSFEFYIFNNDSTNWTHEKVNVTDVSSTPLGVTQNGPGLVLVDPDQDEFGALVGVAFNPAVYSYTVNVTLEGYWS